MSYTITKFARKPLVLGPALLALSACGGGGVTNVQDVQANNARVAGQFAQTAPQLTNIRDSGRPANIQVDKGLYLADRGFRSGRGNPLPQRFETPNGVTINTATPVNIEQLSQMIEEITGIRVDYEDLRIGGAAAQAAPAAAAQQDSGGQAVGALISASQSTGTGPLEKTFRIRHTGKLSAVLDTVASRLSSDWAYEGGRIVFKGPQTVTYTIWAQPSQTGSQSSIGGGEANFGGGSTQTTSQLTNDYWESIEEGVAALMPDNARYSVNQSSGTITVTGVSAVHLRVQDFIENENRRLSRQVAIKLDVVAFTSTRSDNRSTAIGIDNILSQIGSGLAVSAGSQVERGAGGTISAGVSGNDGNLNATFQTLSSLGQVSVLQSQSITAMNNTPTPVSIGNERAYVAGTQTTIVDGEENISLETGIINTGLNFVVTPRIMSSNQVVLSYTLNISELLNLQSFDTGDSSVQLPEVATRNFMQTVNIRSGDTVVIASTDIQNNGNQRTGPFDPRAWAVGGSRSYNIDNTKIMVLMTPVVVDGSNTPRARR